MEHARLLKMLGLIGLVSGMLIGCTSAQKSHNPAAAGADAHTSQNSLDWAGSYKGTLPCADCPGIETVVTLSEDGQFRSQMRYMERSDEIYSESGQFTWDDTGNVVIAGGVHYQVGENKITLLDQDGNPITSGLQKHYVLSKLPAPGLAGTYWRLVELRGAAVADTPKPAYIRLDEQTKRVTGSGGCNVISGGYELHEPNRLRFGQMISTKMACASGMDVEQQFLEVLGQADSYTLNGEKLQLFRARMAPLAVMEADRLR
jgi:copper homeostasis protein (lipoprotein)